MNRLMPLFTAICLLRPRQRLRAIFQPALMLIAIVLRYDGAMLRRILL